MSSDKNEVNKLVEYLIKQEIEGLKRDAKEQTRITAQKATPKQDKTDSGRS